MKIIIQFMICLMIWVVVEAQCISNAINSERHYIIQNTKGEVKHIRGLNVDGIKKKLDKGTILIVGDRIEGYNGRAWEGYRYKKIEYRRKR